MMRNGIKNRSSFPLGHTLIGACAGLLFLSSTAHAESRFASAQDTEPSKLGWMQGFPVPKNKQLRFADGSFFEFPALRWSVAHMRELMPTVNVSRGLARRLNYLKSWMRRLMH